jgi:hypothetical protein
MKDCDKQCAACPSGSAALEMHACLGAGEMRSVLVKAYYPLDEAGIVKVTSISQRKERDMQRFGVFLTAKPLLPGEIQKALTNFSSLVMLN